MSDQDCDETSFCSCNDNEYQSAPSIADGLITTDTEERVTNSSVCNDYINEDTAQKHDEVVEQAVDPFHESTVLDNRHNDRESYNSNMEVGANGPIRRGDDSIHEKSFSKNLTIETIEETNIHVDFTDQNKTPSLDSPPEDETMKIQTSLEEDVVHLASLDVSIAATSGELDVGSTKNPISPSQDVSSPNASISNGYILPTKDERLTVFNRLRAYEAKRRMLYENKLTSSLIYWRSLCEIIAASLEETERVESIINANILMQEQFAEHCRGVVEDRIDFDGKVLDSKKAKKNQDERRIRYRNLASGWKSILLISDSKKGGKVLGFSLPSSPTSDTSMDDKRFDATSNRSKLLKPILDCHTLTADRFIENTTYIREEVWLPLIKLRTILDDHINLMEKMGSAIIDQLDNAENTVKRAWANYYSAQKKATTSANTLPTDENSSPNKVDDCGDVWVVEMQYLTAVAYLTSHWEKSSARLAKLFASTKELECNRRSRLRDILSILMQKQELLWLNAQTIIGPVVRDLFDRPIDHLTVETSVQESIQIRAEELLYDNKITRKAPDIDELSSIGLVGMQDRACDDELSSPLLSELLCKANVIERKVGVLGWKPTLAVATADSFLHLFDLSSAAPVQSGSAAEVAFHVLLPAVEIPSETSVKAGKTAVQGKSLIETLTPDDSIKLRNAAVTFSDINGNTVFEISETFEATGASKVLVFGKVASKKVVLRTVSRAETVAWIAALKGSRVKWNHPWTSS